LIVVIGCYMPFLLNLDQRFLNRVLIIINSNVNIPQTLVTVDKFGYHVSAHWLTCSQIILYYLACQMFNYERT
jgi:hypothetical protein